MPELLWLVRVLHALLTHAHCKTSCLGEDISLLGSHSSYSLHKTIYLLVHVHMWCPLPMIHMVKWNWWSIKDHLQLDLVFGGSFCLKLVSWKLYGSKKYSWYWQAKPTNHTTVKKFPSSIYIFPREYDQIWDITQVRPRIGGSLFKPMFKFHS